MVNDMVMTLAIFACPSLIDSKSDRLCANMRSLLIFIESFSRKVYATGEEGSRFKLAQFYKDFFT
jgi:hypothetical protein